MDAITEEDVETLRQAISEAGLTLEQAGYRSFMKLEELGGGSATLIWDEENERHRVHEVEVALEVIEDWAAEIDAEPGPGPVSVFATALGQSEDPVKMDAAKFGMRGIESKKKDADDFGIFLDRFGTTWRIFPSDEGYEYEVIEH